MGETQKASMTAEKLFNLAGENIHAKLAHQNGQYSSGTELKLRSLGKGGVPSQVIEMNENVRELVIDASMR